ncbi:MAG: AMIN domain-containing protein [candidate division Zixibacteria bacterium]|nr:AMIN domain-containing protein [candidate division Zixibacteria bacterium]
MRILKSLAIILLLYGIGLANIELNNIAITQQADSVYIEISTSKPCTFDHFMIKEAPEKIVVDLNGTINNWPKKKFLGLPLKSIERIRTSQFQVTPDLITRVVLDINRPIGYRAETTPMGLKIIIPATAGEQAFQPWTAKQALKTVIPQQAQKRSAPPKIKKDKPARKAKPRVNIDSFPKRKVVKYKAGTQRDPFKALAGQGGTNLASGEVPAIENLILVGVFDDETGDKALFEDAEGNGFILKPNDRVKNGYLVSIRKDKAIFQVTEYGWTRTVALVLRVPELK